MAGMDRAKTADVEALRREASRLAAESARMTEAYRRRTWILYTLVFFPVPMTVLLLRFQMEGWHYYLAGGAYIVFSMILFTIDSAASEKCDRAQRAAGRARQAYELASYPLKNAAP
jgi:hypothetical protein